MASGDFPPTAELKLRPERSLLPEREAGEWLARGEDGYFVVDAGRSGPPPLPQLLGKGGGPDVPDWWTATPTIVQASVLICQVADALVWPGFGVVASRKGDVPLSTHGEAKFVHPDFAGMPNVTTFTARPALVMDPDIEDVGPARIALPWGGLSNYGHFLLDALPSAFLMRDLAEARSHRYLFPVLKNWHREHLRLLGLERWEETASSIVATSGAIFCTAMDHYLHAPGEPITWVRREQLRRVGGATLAGARIYLSRRGYDIRTFESESVLESVLSEKLGFVCIDPATLTVEDQLRMFRGASAVVGPTGAAFANLMYVPRGCTVVEIQPRFLQGIWVRNLTQLLGLAYHPFFVPATAAEKPPVIGGIERPDIGQRFAVDVETFVDFVSQCLER